MEGGAGQQLITPLLMRLLPRSPAAACRPPVWLRRCSCLRERAHQQHLANSSHAPSAGSPRQNCMKCTQSHYTPAPEPVQQVSAHLRAVALQLLLVNDPQHSAPSGHGHRVAACGASERLSELVPCLVCNVCLYGLQGEGEPLQNSNPSSGLFQRRLMFDGVLQDSLERAPNVLKCRRCASTAAISGVVTTAPSGSPLPMPLAMVTMSGMTPCSQISKGNAR